MTASKSLKTRNPQKIKTQKRNAAQKVRRQKLGFIATISFVMIVSILIAKSWNNLNKIQIKDERIINLEQEYNHRRINNDALQQKVDAPVDDEYIMEIVRGEGYRGSDEILFYLGDGE